MTKQLRLEAEEWAYLTTHFHLYASESTNAASSLPAADLLDLEKCVAFLDRLTEILQSPSRRVTASLFAKRYVFLAVMPRLYAMTLYNKGVSAAMAHSHLEWSTERGEHWLSAVRLSRFQLSLPAEGARSQWRDALLWQLFAENIAPTWRAIAQAANVSKLVLWENTAVRLFSLYEKRMLAMATSEQQRARIADDFAYLLCRAPAVLFGEAKNPFALFAGDTCTGAAVKPAVRIRKTCCYYYAVSEARDYCSVCPNVRSR